MYRKRLSNRWQAPASYNWNDGKGNSNSDGNADFQGDVLFLDPRAPNQYGTQPGLIRHLVEGRRFVHLADGPAVRRHVRLELRRSHQPHVPGVDRNLPIRVLSAEAYSFGGTTQRWIAPDTVGAYQNPGYATFDLRTQYNKRVGKYNYEVFVDMFNLFNAQSTILENDLVAGLGTVPFGGEVQWVLPRRAFLGARVRF